MNPWILMILSKTIGDDSLFNPQISQITQISIKIRHTLRNCLGYIPRGLPRGLSYKKGREIFHGPMKQKKTVGFRAAHGLLSYFLYSRLTKCRQHTPAYEPATTTSHYRCYKIFEIDSLSIFP
jgi:hypothetical protein